MMVGLFGCGDCHTPSLVIKLGAQIEAGRFFVPEDELGLTELMVGS